MRHDLHSDVSAFSTTRQGGISVGEYSTFNINPFVGDDPLHVASNLLTLAVEVGVAQERIVLPHQVHGVRVLRIDETFPCRPESDRRLALEGIDALITNVPFMCIGVSTADCIPIFFYDERHHAVGVAHAGWRGTVAKISCKTLHTMQQEYGTEPSDVLAAIGPGISVDHFEVGDEVYEAFSRAGFDMELLAVRHERWHIDLPGSNAWLLQQCGVRAENIVRSPFCTYADNHLFFSARRQGALCGRIYNGILLLK